MGIDKERGKGIKKKLAVVLGGLLMLIGFPVILMGLQGSVIWLTGSAFVGGSLPLFRDFSSLLSPTLAVKWG